MVGHILPFSRLEHLHDFNVYISPAFEPRLIPLEMIQAWQDLWQALYVLVFPHFLGPFGVSLFFLISGYVISLSFQHKMGAVSFAKARFLRIYPVHWAALVLVLWLTAVTYGAGGSPLPYSARSIFLNFFNIQNLFEPMNINPVIWSLVREEVFYITISLQVWLGRKITVRNSLIAIAALVSVVGLRWYLHATSQKQFVALNALASTSHHVVFIYFGTLIFVYDQRIETRRNSLEKYLVLSLCMALFVLANSFYNKVDNGLPNFPFGSYLFSLVLFLMLIRFKNLNFKSAVLEFFAKISYPLYLVHVTVGWLVLYFASRANGSYLFSLALAFAGPIVIATLIHFAVEKPTTRLSKKVKTHLRGQIA